MEGIWGNFPSGSDYYVQIHTQYKSRLDCVKKLISLWQQNKEAFVGKYIESTVEDSMSEMWVSVLEEHQTSTESQKPRRRW